MIHETRIIWAYTLLKLPIMRLNYKTKKKLQKPSKIRAHTPWKLPIMN